MHLYFNKQQKKMLLFINYDARNVRCKTMTMKKKKRARPTHVATPRILKAKRKANFKTKTSLAFIQNNTGETTFKPIRRLCSVAQRTNLIRDFCFYFHSLLLILLWNSFRALTFYRKYLYKRSFIDIFTRPNFFYTYKSWIEMNLWNSDLQCECH